MSGIVGNNTNRGSGIVKAAVVGADAVDGSNIADDAIDSEHYADGSIDNAHIADDAIDSEHYADGSIDNAHIADDAIDSEHYADGSIDNAHIADDAIDSEHYAAGSIDTAHIATNQIDETLMKDAFVGDFTDATVTASDYFIHGDATDSGNTKKDTVQGILDLVSAGGFTPGARVRCSAATSINNASFTKVPFDTEVFDTDSDFDTTNNRFIVGTSDAGIFLFTTSIMFSNLTADKTMRLCWYVNGSLVEQTYHTTSNATTSGGTTQAIFDLAATDYVEVFVYHDGGGAETLSGATGSHLFFNIQKIGPA